MFLVVLVVILALASIILIVKSSREDEDAEIAEVIVDVTKGDKGRIRMNGVVYKATSLKGDIIEEGTPVVVVGESGGLKKVRRVKKGLFR